MRDEYDFSQGQRGKFYRSDTKLNIPIYLDEEILTFVEKIALKKGIDKSSVVNLLLKGDMKIAEVMEWCLRSKVRKINIQELNDYPIHKSGLFLKIYQYQKYTSVCMISFPQS